ncbi:RsmB/NOP family class I SAM-dependent RNA methyltransferase [Rheinheimera sp. F8]|uniref:RsmB/NOP family class I SAM-dependent RNA methyltransferase n=1 Tax=Rheinheimera sp. F8 TaxID=1763998 RepID=UPI000744966B|nr:RsmB/NOP family class I SAM-dependent RNA methyltransferase [Rheinheimera sp. F8]ALZ76907.1 SAM-dependent methyltransferase [Rheinheimera sp. F8]
MSFVHHEATSPLLYAILQLVLQQDQQLERAMAQVFAAARPAVGLQSQVVWHCGAFLRKLNAYQQLAGAEASLADTVALYFAVQQDAGDITQRWQQLPPAMQDGCPDWLDQLGQAELGSGWPAERAALAQAAPRFVRVNSLKTNRDALQRALAQAGIQSKTVDGVDSALEITSDGALFQTEPFKLGWFEQQDAGSQLIAAALPVMPGSRVIDACAGAGGKTLALAARMQAKGRLLAMDVEQWKLDNLQQRANRAGAANIETRLISSSKTIKRLAGKADFLLLDVPCSGSGVLRRNPDAKWRSPMRLAELRVLQQDILQRYSKMLCVGGELVYATCSIFPSENRGQIDAFLASRPDFQLLSEQHISPAATGFDGFYAAHLRRISELS